MRYRNGVLNRHIFQVLAIFQGYDIICLNAGRQDIRMRKLRNVLSYRMRTLLLSLDPLPKGSDHKISRHTASQTIIDKKNLHFLLRGLRKRILRKSAYSRANCFRHGAVPRSGR